jgi:hypothetical protein
MVEDIYLRIKEKKLTLSILKASRALKTNTTSHNSSSKDLMAASKAKFLLNIHL